MEKPRDLHHQPECDNLTSAGIDWLTCTAPHGQDAQVLWIKAHSIIDLQVAGGNDDQALRWKGYEVRAAGQARVGRRADGVLVQLSGAVAARHAVQLLPYATNVSRLDLQVTGEYRSPQPQLAREAFRALPDRQTGRGRPRSVTVIANRQGGDTLLLGSRASDVYARHYDKGVEGKTHRPGRLWRWELEFKRAAALRQRNGVLATGAVPLYTQRQVFSWFVSFGMAPGFSLRRYL